VFLTILLESNYQLSSALWLRWFLFNIGDFFNKRRCRFDILIRNSFDSGSLDFTVGFKFSILNVSFLVTVTPTNRRTSSLTFFSDWNSLTSKAYISEVSFALGFISRWWPFLARKSTIVCKPILNSVAALPKPYYWSIWTYNSFCYFKSLLLSNNAVKLINLFKLWF